MNWVLQSRKAQIALGSLLTILLSRLLPRLGSPASASPPTTSTRSVRQS